MSNELFVAILAAGEASRFGGRKLDAVLSGKPLGRHALDTALAVGASTLVIVTGDPPPTFAAQAAKAGEAEIIVNPNARLGLGTSVALAALHAEQSGSGKLLLMLADMPLVRQESLFELIDAATSSAPAAARYPGDIAGIPACFTQDFYKQLQDLDGERGAGKLLQRLPATVLAGMQLGELSDVDTQDDLRAVAALRRKRPL
jgi:CTP:molybdopterin cytidylyltransferase MocA